MGEAPSDDSPLKLLLRGSVAYASSSASDMLEVGMPSRLGMSMGGVRWRWLQDERHRKPPPPAGADIGRVLPFERDPDVVAFEERTCISENRNCRVGEEEEF